MTEQNADIQNEENNKNDSITSNPGCSSVMQIMTFISALVFICVIVFILNKISLSASTLRTVKHVCIYLGAALSVFFYLAKLYFIKTKDLLQANYYKISEFCKNPIFLCGCGLLSTLYLTHSYQWYSVLAGIILIKISADIALDTYVYKLKTRETDTTEPSVEQVS